MQKYFVAYTTACHHETWKIYLRAGGGTLATCCLETGHGVRVKHGLLLHLQREGCGSSPSWNRRAKQVIFPNFLPSIESLPCSRHDARHWGHRGEQSRSVCPAGTYRRREEQSLNKNDKYDERGKAEAEGVRDSLRAPGWQSCLSP